MDFSYYIYFFHDGGISQIIHDERQILITMNSSALDPQDNRDRITLNEESCIFGQLILSNPHQVIVNDREISQPLSMMGDDGEILDFSIQGKRLELGIEWCEYKRDFGDSTVFTNIEIDCEEIFWKDLLTNMKINLTGLHAG